MMTAQKSYLNIYLTFALALPIAQYPWVLNCGLWTTGVGGLSYKDSANDN